jgi:hypothetical protein
MAVTVGFGSGVTLADSPTTKEDCKNGGYAKYGFKNQGQCIKAVSTAPPPPVSVLDVDNSESAEYSRYFFRSGYASEDSADRYPSLVQTFTAGRSGTLTGVDLWLKKEQVQHSGARVEILAASDPPSSTAEVLGTTRFEIPDGWADGTIDCPCELAEARFEDGVPVQGGQQYTIHLAMDGNEDLGIAQTTTSDYSGGSLWSYYVGGPNANPVGGGYGVDLRFRTYVAE